MNKIAVVYLGLLAFAQAQAYTGHGNSEVILSFNHVVELSPDMVTPSQMQEQVADQVHYMFGPISDQFGPPSQSIVGGELGAPRIDDQERLFRADTPFVATPADPNRPGARRAPLLRAPIIRLGQVFRNGGKTLLPYTYQGPMVLRNGLRTQMKLALPNNPKTIFQSSEALKPTPNSVNRCSDADFQSDGDFFYFWSPDRPGCRLQAGRDFTVVTAAISRLPNERATFPEYSKLPDASGNILITLIMGKDTVSRVRSPIKIRGRQDDLNALNFRKIADHIEGTQEFTRRVWTPTEVRDLVTHADLRPQPFVVDYTHTYRANSPRAKSLTLRMVFTNADIGVANSVGMHRFFEHSIEHGAVTIYDGHSGLGSNLDLGSMRAASRNSFRFNFPKNRYQIFFFNSCSSYSYYTDLFFDQKRIPGSGDIKGSKFLDILATGLETAFEGGEKTDLALINAIHLWGKSGQETSYQTLATRMEADNLFGVNGDEDNPTVPQNGMPAAPPPPLAGEQAPEFEALEQKHGPRMLPPLELPEFPDSVVEQGAISSQE